VTFVRADQWIGAWQEPDPDEALLEVLRRYITAYGPITAQDFARWFWLDPAEAAGLIQKLARELVEVDVEGRRAWRLAADTRGPRPRAVNSLRLVPQYDCYLLGSNPRERLLPDVARKRVFAYGRGRYEGAVGLPILLVDGVVSGMWERRQRGKQTELWVEPFVRLDKAQRARLEAEAARVGRFLDLAVTLTIGRLD
jgi:uncharacterized protein YcaQ